MEMDYQLLREYIRLLERKLGVLEDGELSCCGISFAQCHALVEIGRSRGLSLNRLAEILNLDNSTMSRTVNHLVTKHLAKRETDTEDRRCICIKLTAKGEALFKEIEQNMGNVFKSTYEKIPEEKRPQVLESLQILLNALEQGCCPKPAERE